MISKEDRIKLYVNVFKDENIKNMFLASLISSDSLINEHYCNTHLDIVNFILENFDEIVNKTELTKENISKLKDYMLDAKDVIERDRKIYIENKQS